MRDFSGVKRVVIKVGSNVLAPQGIPDEARLDDLAGQVVALRQRHYIPLVVSSGAISFGARALGLQPKPKKVERRQACAAVGQPILMNHWRKAFQRHGCIAAQVLLSRETFDERRSYLNLRHVIEDLLQLGTLPVLNENDSVSTAEIGNNFGDNDSLSAHVASKLGADLLILLSDIDALHDKDPRSHQDSQPLKIVKKINQEHHDTAGDAGSVQGTGGMKTKLTAIELVARADCQTVLADGREKNILKDIFDGKPVGTLFLTGQHLNARARWILGARAKGSINIDLGALKALQKRKSLLPSGIIGVTGFFAAGEVIRIGTHYQAISLLSSEELRQVLGLHSQQARKILGPQTKEEAVRAEDIVELH